MTKIEKTVKDINDLWLFHIKTSRLRRNLQKKEAKKNSLNSTSHRR